MPQRLYVQPAVRARLPLDCPMLVSKAPRLIAETRAEYARKTPIYSQPPEEAGGWLHVKSILFRVASCKFTVLGEDTSHSHSRDTYHAHVD